MSALLLAVTVSTAAQESELGKFLRARFASSNASSTAAIRAEPPKLVCDIDRDELSRRIFREYGAAFAANASVKVAPRCIFDGPSDVDEFQRTLKTERGKFESVDIVLQEAALRSLVNAYSSLLGRGRRITPLDGAIAGGRSYAETVRLWNSRFVPALAFWVASGRIDIAEAEAVSMMDPLEQARKVMKWEAAGMNFGTNRSGSIFSSVAPPGTSQHLSLLAFDVAEYADPEVRRTLNDFGWFQTVVNDPPHFTFLGVAEKELPARGLKAVFRGGHMFWVPKLERSVTRTVP